MIERTARELVGLLASGEITSQALSAQFLDAIRQRDPRLKAFLLVDEELVQSQAKAVDAKRDKGEPVGRLAGLPVAVKDIICTKGQRTTCASKILANFKPPYDAHVVERLRQEDAVLIGKTNMDEFGMGSSNENSGFHPTYNPWDRERIPGGSSGGSAAAVAASEAPAALGTDTGGSIRMPASLCGVVGLKPTYGRVSRYGMIAYGSSLDQIGPFGREVSDIALLLEIIAGHDKRDSTSVDRPVPPYSEILDKPVERLTLGIAKEHFGEGVDAEVRQAVQEAIEVFKDAGAKVQEVSLPHTKYTIATYYLIATAEASSNLARYDGVHYGHRAAEYKDLIDMYCRTRDEGFGAEVKRRIMLGTYALSSGYKDAYYLKALKVRRLIQNDYAEAFKRCHVIVGPTSPTPAYKIGEKIDDPLAMYLTDIYTNGANLAGIPALSIPCGFSKSGLPVGLQLHAAAFEEEKLLRVARMFESATDWHAHRPKL